MQEPKGFLQGPDSKPVLPLGILPTPAYYVSQEQQTLFLTTHSRKGDLKLVFKA